MKSLIRGAYLRGVSAKALSSAVLAISLAACTANPTPLDRPGDVPPGFTAPMATNAPVWPQNDWWSKYGAEELVPLQETAQKENLDIAVADAAARVLQAEANDGAVALSALFPTLGASVGASRIGGNSRIPRARQRQLHRRPDRAVSGAGCFGADPLDLAGTLARTCAPRAMPPPSPASPPRCKSRMNISRC